MDGQFIIPPTPKLDLLIRYVQQFAKHEQLGTKIIHDLSNKMKLMKFLNFLRKFIWCNMYFWLWPIHSFLICPLDVILSTPLHGFTM